MIPLLIPFLEDVRELRHFINVKVVQNKENGSIYIDQPFHIESVLQK